MLLHLQRLGVGASGVLLVLAVLKLGVMFVDAFGPMPLAFVLAAYAVGYVVMPGPDYGLGEDAPIPPPERD